jgi:hypothetical protein
VTGACAPVTPAINLEKCNPPLGVIARRVGRVTALLRLQIDGVQACAHHVDDDVAAQLLARLLRAVNVLEGGA